MDDLRCIGCGSVIQTSDPAKAGYVPSSVLEKGPDTIVCRRCFRLQHYNEVTPSMITPEEFYAIVSAIGATDSLVVMVVDLFDLEGSLLPQIARLTNHNDMIVVANKRDLLPKVVSDAKLRHHITQVIHAHDLRPKDVLLLSATKRTHLDQVMDAMLHAAKGRDIYIVGATNVGKSTFVNAILKSYADLKHDVITVSRHAGTTLDQIRIPLGDQDLIDTPGILQDIQLTHHVSPEARKVLNPTKEIKPKVYQLDADQTLFFNGFARIDFLEGPKTSFVCYLGEHVYIHRTKRTNADAFYQTHRYDLLKYPEETTPFVLKPHRLRITGKQDVVLPGLGFVTIQGPATILVHVHEKTVPYARAAII
jgi:ribosome biogenesis GTPase YqeH